MPSDTHNPAGSNTERPAGSLAGKPASTPARSSARPIPSATPTVALVGTFDTKGAEFLYVKERFEELGIKTLTVHCGIFEPAFDPDVSNGVVAACANVRIADLAAEHDRAHATEVMTKGLVKYLPDLHKHCGFQGVFSMGGSGGTSIATAAMQQLPLGVPKIMVSTMASGDTRPYVGASDICFFPSIVDVAGINTFSAAVFGNAVHAMAGMLLHPNPAPASARPLVACTMFGVTTPCITQARQVLEEHGYETLVFHATGTGGQCMENMVKGGFIKGVLDLTTTEWCDELFGGILAAGPARNMAAVLTATPAVVSVGAMDMVNFGPYDTLPEWTAGRNLYRHNPSVTLMRTTPEENRKLGQTLADKLNRSRGPVTLMLPLEGVSSIDAPGQPFHDPEADAALFDALRTSIDPDVVELEEISANINDEVFARRAALKLVELMGGPA